MKKETLNKALELERQIEEYNEIIYAMTFPWQKYKLWGRQAYLGAGGHNQNREITLADKELAKLIEDYCRTKVKTLQKELEEL
jgi:hypothetical protein